MALQLVYPLRKGTYRRVRGFKDHKVGWAGIDDGCKTGTPLYAVRSGKVSHSVKQSVGGGWNFRLNFNSPKGWFYWYAHCSSIPTNGRVFKAGQVVGKSGNTGGSTGPHLHHSLLYKGVAKDPDNPNVVKWVPEMYKGKSAENWYNAYKHAISVATLRSNRFGVVAKRLASLLNKPVPKPDDFKIIVGYLDSLKKNINTLNKDMGAVQIEYTALRLKMDKQARQIESLQKELKDCQNASKEPEGPSIPRVTRFDNFWARVWKRTLQFIAGKKLPKIRFTKVTNFFKFLVDTIRGKL